MENLNFERIYCMIIVILFNDFMAYGLDIETFVKSANRIP